MPNKPDSAVDALDRMIGASIALQAASSAAVVQLTRTLAAQIDAANGDPNTRLAAAYLSALKDLRRLTTEGVGTPKSASRLALIKAQAQQSGGAE